MEGWEEGQGWDMRLLEGQKAQLLSPRTAHRDTLLHSTSDSSHTQYQCCSSRSEVEMYTVGPAGTEHDQDTQARAG